MDLVPTVPAVTVVQRRPQNDGFLLTPAVDEAPSFGRSHKLGQLSWSVMDQQYKLIWDE